MQARPRRRCPADPSSTQLHGQLDHLGYVGLLPVAPFGGENTLLAEVFDERTRRSFSVRFGFSRPCLRPGGRRPDPAARGMSSTVSSVGIHRHVLTVSRFRLTSRLRSLPDEVRGSEPGGRNTTSVGTTPHSEATRCTSALRRRGFVVALELRGDHQALTYRALVGTDGHDRAFAHTRHLGRQRARSRSGTCCGPPR